MLSMSIAMNPECALSASSFRAENDPLTVTSGADFFFFVTLFLVWSCSYLEHYVLPFACAHAFNEGCELDVSVLVVVDAFVLRDNHLEVF